MSESIESLPANQIKDTLLSSDFQWALARDMWTDDSFGVSKKTNRLALESSLKLKFPDLTDEFVQKAESNQFKFGARNSSHIKRLTDPNRTVPENYFGLLCACYGVGEDGYHILPSVASDEFNNTSFFWSLGPYIAQELRYYGVPPEHVVESIFKWGKEADRKKPLPGTADYLDLNAFHSAGFILTKNHDGYSHKFAQGLSRIICQEVGIFKDAIAKDNPMHIRDTQKPLILKSESATPDFTDDVRRNIFLKITKDGRSSLDGQYGIKKIIDAEALPSDMDCTSYVFGDWKKATMKLYHTVANSDVLKDAKPFSLAVYGSNDGEGIRHVGIVLPNLKVISKWESGPVYEHPANSTPMTYGPVEYYKADLHEFWNDMDPSLQKILIQKGFVSPKAG